MKRIRLVLRLLVESARVEPTTQKGGYTMRPPNGYFLRMLFIPLIAAVVTACNPTTPATNANRSTNRSANLGMSGKAAQQASSSNISDTTSSSNPKLPGLSLDWPYFGNNLWQDRFSPNQQLNPASAQKLRTAFRVTLPDSNGGNESYPTEVHGALYVTTRNADVIAVNAATGTVLWIYRAPKSTVPLPHINRGVAVSNGKVYVLTADDRLIALDATDGHIIFQVQAANPSTGVFESMAPLVADGSVFVGSSGGDEGARGFVEAFSASTGTKLWKFNTVPPRGQGWLPATGSHGGGAVWTTPTYDTATHSLYFGTGNPSPDYYGVSRPGPDPYTDSLVRLNATNGRLSYARQEVSHDLWDYDVASPPILFTVHHQQVVGEAGKDGEWYEWYAASGKPVTAPVAFVKISHTPPTAHGVKEWPGPNGGANYGPSAYDPLTHQVFVAGINGPETLYASPTGHAQHAIDLGTAQNPGPVKAWHGTITAIDVRTGHIDWQVDTPTPPIGGVTVSAGGIVWYGEPNGTLTGRSTENGKLIWQQNLSAPIGSAPILYQQRGHTYLCVVTGGAASLATLFPYNGPAQLIGFELP